MVKPLIAKLERTGDRQIDQAQRNAHETTRRLASSPSGAGAFATTVDAFGKPTRDITFTAGGSVQMRHGLELPKDGVPSGWIATETTTGYASFRRTAWDDKTITIQAENACTARFWVFA